MKPSVIGAAMLLLLASLVSALPAPNDLDWGILETVHKFWNMEALFREPLWNVHGRILGPNQIQSLMAELRREWEESDDSKTISREQQETVDLYFQCLQSSINGAITGEEHNDCFDRLNVRPGGVPATLNGIANWRTARRNPHEPAFFFDRSAVVLPTGRAVRARISSVVDNVRSPAFWRGYFGSSGSGAPGAPGANSFFGRGSSSRSSPAGVVPAGPGNFMPRGRM